MIYCEKIHKRGIAAISTLLGAGGILFIRKEINKLIEFISNLDSTSQIVVIGMILSFILLFSVFVIKPITLALIRWIIFKKMHNEELSNSNTTSNLLAQNKMDSLSKALFSELDQVDKESIEDFEKIEKIADYQDRMKKEQ